MKKALVLDYMGFTVALEAMFFAGALTGQLCIE
jgi:hypothetical protein